MTLGDLERPLRTPLHITCIFEVYQKHLNECRHEL